MGKTWVERQRERGVKLELTPFPARSCWKKFRGKVHYLHHPLTKAGYEAALLEWRSIAADADRSRPHAHTYHRHRDLFRRVLNWYDQFGTPEDETTLARQVAACIEWIDGLLQQPTLSPCMPAGGFTLPRQNVEFFDEFVRTDSGFTLFGDEHYRLPGKWEERIRQLDARPERFAKEPQTVGHWLDRYLIRTGERAYDAIKIRTVADRVHKLKDFRRWAPLESHVAEINDDLVRRYHTHLARTARSRKTKQEYFKAFRMFVRWAAKQTSCELEEPATLDDREFVFRDAEGVGRSRERKKRHLWTADEFRTVLEAVPQPYRCFVALMLNCGFRNTDLSNLKWADLRPDEGRIVYQREKLNQNETSPVVSYLLWPKTQELLREAISDDEEYVFASETGGRLVVEKQNAAGKAVVYDIISRYWRRNREKFGLDGKRLDYIRKTGSTCIEKFDRGVEVLYLADSLTSVPRIHYNFNDGEPFPELDMAITHLGNVFGMCDKPVGQTLQVPDAVMKSLEEKARARGITVDDLLASI